MAKEKYRGVVYQGLETALENWQHANRLADWLQTPPPQTGIIAVVDARARHVLQACELLHIPVPEKLCVIGIDNEELTRYLSRVALSSVAQGTRQMGYQAAKLLHRLLNNEALLLQRQLIPPMRVVERRSTDYRSLNDPSVIQAMHYRFATMLAKASRWSRCRTPSAFHAPTWRNALKRMGRRDHPHGDPQRETGKGVRSLLVSTSLRSMKFHRCAATRRCNISIRCLRKSTT